MLKVTIEAANYAELHEQVLELAENLSQKDVAVGTTAATIHPTSPLIENNTAENQQAAKSARKPRKTKGAEASDNVSGASDEKFPAGASASPNVQATTPVAASVPSIAPSTPATNPFMGGPAVSAPAPASGPANREQLSIAINNFLDAPNGGMDAALAILAKYGAKKMSDVQDAQIPAVIAELTGSKPQAANSIFS